MIIGISGKIGSGKSTLAKMLVEALGPGWVRMSLGDEVKKEAAEMFGFDVALAYSPEGKNSVLVGIDTFIGGINPSLTVREILQYWGTDVRRAEDPNYWVKKLAAAIPAGKSVVIDDIRFHTEAEFVLGLGGKLFRLDLYPEYQPPAVGSEHTSETELDDYPGFHGTFAPRFGELRSVAYEIVKYLDVQPTMTLLVIASSKKLPGHRETINALRAICDDPSAGNIDLALRVARRAELYLRQESLSPSRFSPPEHHSV